MALDTVGILTPIDFPLEQVAQISAVTREVFTNEQPLFSRLPHVRATSETYTINRYDVRGGLNRRTYAVGTGGITNAATSLPIADASMFQVGDVLELQQSSANDSGGTAIERVEVLAPPNLTANPNTLTIRRAREGTTAVAFAATDVIYLVGNARTGGEVDQQGFRPTVTGLQQVVQTFQYPVQVGGKAEALQNVALPPGVNSVMGRDRAIKMVEFIRDVENTFYYGMGEVPMADGDRGKAKGLRTLIASYNGGSNVTSGTALTNFTRQQFIAATIAKIYAAGGMADTIVCSTDFLGFLDTWVPNKTAMMGEGTTKELGFPITTFVLPLNGQPLSFVPSLQMRPGTAAVLSSNDIDVRVLRDMFWQPRGNRGDAWMGDWIGDYCINLAHPQWHAWLEGIQTAA